MPGPSVNSFSAWGWKFPPFLRGETPRRRPVAGRASHLKRDGCGTAIPSAGEKLHLRLVFFRVRETDAYAEEADGAVGAAFPGVC